jgi:hypothetical protein
VAADALSCDAALRRSLSVAPLSAQALLDTIGRKVGAVLEARSGSSISGGDSSARLVGGSASSPLPSSPRSFNLPRSTESAVLGAGVGSPPPPMQAAGSASGWATRTAANPLRSVAGLGGGGLADAADEVKVSFNPLRAAAAV